MAVKMRLRRMGQKKAPFYRIIVADSRSPRDGRFIDEIGTYDPNCDPSAIKVDEEAAKKWLANGVKEQVAVRGLVDSAGKITPVGEDIEVSFLLQPCWE